MVKAYGFKLVVAVVWVGLEVSVISVCRGILLLEFVG